RLTPMEPFILVQTMENFTPSVTFQYLNIEYNTDNRSFGSFPRSMYERLTGTLSVHLLGSNAEHWNNKK
ncbi:MAG TPA: hypothetical protein ACFYDZ_06390, partial [Candidatus Brocadiaceae bacterium]